jgi:hypothetical protein
MIPKSGSRFSEKDHAQTKVRAQKQSGTVPKHDPAIRFHQYAGATIAHQRTHMYRAMAGRFGQVNNV